MTAVPARAGWRFRQPSVIPGFGLTLGLSLAYLTLIILIPLSGLAWRSASLGWPQFWAILTDARTINALKISFGTALAAAVVNVVFGTVVAWVLVRYRFPGRRIVDALVDLPFALPTAVAGIALTTLYAPNGWIGGPLASLNIKVAYTPLGIVIALVFIGLPFVVRTVQPVMEEIDREIEEAAATLGATRFQTASRSPSRAAWANTAPSSSSPATCPTCRRSHRCSSSSGWRNTTIPPPRRSRRSC
jgi:sulfate transport system permease protein